MSKGKVVSVNISAGGVPKKPVDCAELRIAGFMNDGHHDTKHHGGLDRAVCIYASEIIDALRMEGHPIFAGSSGENITISGIDWGEIIPGLRLKIGDALVELTSYTSPCRTIRASFVNGRFQRISQKANPGWSRVYGRVLGEGLVRTGDSVDRVES